MSELILIIVLSGAGTFLLRFLPIWRGRSKSGAPTVSPRLRSFLQGVGPAAMTALLVVSLWSLIQGSTHAAQGLITIVALAVIYGTWRWRRGIAVPTLVGALSYGALIHFFG